MSAEILLVVLHRVGSSTPLFYATQDYVAVDAGPFAGQWGGALDDLDIEGRVEQPGLIERTMYGAGKLRGAAPVAAGAIVLTNADGGLDDILNYAFDGQVFEVWRVSPQTKRLVGKLREGFIEQPTYNEKTITFQCRDALHALDIELLTTTYAGTNALPAGVEGTPDDIGGTPKPVLLGTCKNVTPVQVNTSKKIYQLDGVRGFAAGYSLAVYDKRAVVTEDGAGDYTSQADMEANNPTAGQYRVWPAGGMFRINFTPVGALTCDITNPADAASGGVAGLDDVLYTLNQDVLGSRSPDQSLGFLKSGQIYDAVPDVGIYINDTRTALAAVNELLACVSGFVVTGIPLDGSYAGNSLNAGQLFDPSAGGYPDPLAPVEVSEESLVAGTYAALMPPSEADRGLPVWRVNVQYAKNWTLMTANDLAGVAAADVAYYTQEYRTASAEDAGVKTDWPQALELTVTTLIVDAADATAEAQRLLDLFSVPRQRLSLSVPYSYILNNTFDAGSGALRSGEFRVGSRVRLTLPRFGLDAGKTFVVTEMREDYEAEIFNLVVWG